MAIQFNANALSKFSNVNFGQADAIANLGDGDGLVQNGNRGLGVFAKIRFASTKANNNAVRTELLKALGLAFNLQGVGEQGGRTTFSRDFMDRLEQILGPAFKREDFGIDANGVVKSGKPLTQRRIQAVYSAATAYAAENGAVNNAGAVANQANGANIRKFQDVSALLCGGNIAEIVGENRDEGWEERAGDLAVLAAKVNRAALGIAEDGAYARVTHKGVEVELHMDNGQIKADVTIGNQTHPVANLSALREEFCIALDEAVSDLYDSFAEKKDGDLTYGRAVLADKVLGYYKNLAGDDLYTKADCPLRNFASALLITKAKVTDGQIAKLTNSQLADFVTTLCQTGDAPATKELVASTIEDADAEDKQLEEEVNEHVQQQDEEYEQDGDGEYYEEIVENKQGPKPQPNQLQPGVIDINAIDNEPGHNPVPGVNAQNVNAPRNVNAPQLPRITDQDSFLAFFLSLNVDDKFGQVSEDVVAKDVNGVEAQTYTYQGYVFRSASRPPEDPSLEHGFTSQNDLSVPENKTEAMGLGLTTSDGKKGAFGVTGKNGVSTSKVVSGAIAYRGAGSTFYVIDTTKLPQGEKAWDMENIVYQNAYKVRDSEAEDETKGEVNISHVPRNAIVGWAKMPMNLNLDSITDNSQRLWLLQNDPDVQIQFNPEYQP